MSRLHDFERIIDEKLRGLFRGQAPQPGEKRELIEVHRAILDEIASRVESLPRGRRSYPYPQTTVRVLLPDPERRRAYEVAFVEAGALSRDIAGRLSDEHVEMPDAFRVEVELVEELPAGVADRGFDISYRSAEAPRPAAVEIPGIWLKVTNGKAEREEYSFRKTRVNLGRLSDVVDSRQQLIRRNDVAFVESGDAPNPTVSRTHAHIEYDPTTQSFRLFDDHSAQGTRVIRDGGIVNVPQGASKGVQLRAGDEIVLGQARVLFDLQHDGHTQ